MERVKPELMEDPGKVMSVYVKMRREPHILRGKTCRRRRFLHIPLDLVGKACHKLNGPVRASRGV